ncbi:MAG TPA: hypothetical protein VFE50_26085 [Cyclobacteriaceae bacterium]|nr:hypothetical protein [Cyclobacteriaceae bacterium]
MENQRSNPPSEEIDLGGLLSKIGDGIRGAWLGFMRFLALIRRVPFDNKISFIFIIGASVAIGFVFSIYLRKNYYESTMILSSNYLNKRLAESTIEKLGQLAGEGRKGGLSKTLSLKDTLADNIIGFEVKPFVEENDVIELEVLKEQLRTAQGAASAANKTVIDQVIKRIEIENRHAFEITVRTLNPAVIPNLQNAIVNYFRSNPYIKKRIEINKINLDKRREKLASDIRKLDSLKKVIYANYRSMAEQSRQGSNNVILSDKSVTDPVQLYERDLIIYQQLQDVERQLYLQPDFEVVEGFTEFSEPANASVTKMLFYSVIIGIIIAYADVALRSFNKYLANLK